MIWESVFVLQIFLGEWLSPDSALRRRSTLKFTYWKEQLRNPTEYCNLQCLINANKLCNKPLASVLSISQAIISCSIIRNMSSCEVCNVSGNRFKQKCNYHRHVSNCRKSNLIKQFGCNLCNELFVNNANLMPTMPIRDRFKYTK